MPVDSLLRAANLQPRPYQRNQANAVAGHIAEPGLVAARTGRRVIWATHTIRLRMQVLEALRRPLRAAWPKAEGRPLLAERRGRADFPSASRALRLRHALASRQPDTRSTRRTRGGAA